MSRVKEIELKVIPAKIANDFIKKNHYSGKVVSNSFLHFGAFLDKKLHGVMSFGHSLDKAKTQKLVNGTGWNEFCELNRMAFDDYLPRNSESYCIGKALRLLKKNAPHLKWVISFADGCSCGDGTIYRASNFVLTQIKKNSTMWINDKGDKVQNMSFATNPSLDKKQFKPLDGYMLRYIYFIDKRCIKDLNCEIIPFSKIKELGASMYKGAKI
jgi:hypothetical protein